MGGHVYVKMYLFHSEIDFLRAKAEPIFLSPSLKHDPIGIDFAFQAANV